MDQEPLFLEDVFEAYRHAIQRLGGAKKVGSQLFPEKLPEKAGEHLMNCMNRDRAEKLDLEQICWIRREARKLGCHTISAFENQDAGYAPPMPVEPKDEVAELQRGFIESVKEQQRILDRLEKLNSFKAVS